MPPPTATGSIQRDMCLIHSCLGVGEVAVSDHRSSVPSVHHLANIARYKQCMLTEQPGYMSKFDADAAVAMIVLIGLKLANPWHGLTRLGQCRIANVQQT